MWPRETDRLLLRPFTESDVDAIYTLVYADSRVREAWSGYTGTLEAFRSRFAREPLWHAEDGFGFLAVEHKADDQLLGLMGFQCYEQGEDTGHMRFEDPANEVGRDPAQIEVELTYALGHAYWGHGYATEAGRALIQVGFCQLGIARTFQIVKPFLNISVLDNVMVGALARGKSSRQAQNSALEIIDFVGLSEMTHKEAQGLPLPLRKRLELARALATEPKVLLLDEVMAGLNPTEVDELIKLIHEVNHKGVSILLIEHVMQGIMALSQRVIVINYGVKIAEGTPEQVVKDDGVIEAYLGKEFIGAQNQQY